ncbi:MAG: hypothetical protein WDZ37_02540 [Solirubrobacterales bacterium]
MEASPAPKRRWAWLLAGVVVVVAIAAAAWLLLKDDGSKKGEPQAATIGELVAKQASASHPVYWVGPRSGVTYELTDTTSGRIFVRYLPAGVSIGDPRPRFLTVGTYPVRSAYQTLVKLSKRKGTVSTKVGGGIAVQDLKSPTSVYVAYPGLDLQVEVYDRSANAARKLAFSGKVQPIR